jgi:hypothetical protein
MPHNADKRAKAGRTDAPAAKPDDKGECSFSIAELLAAVTESELESIAIGCGRRAEFLQERGQRGFALALARWRRAYVQNIASFHGPSYLKPHVRGPAHGAHIVLQTYRELWATAWRGDMHRVLMFAEKKGAGLWKVVASANREEWIESIIGMLRNPAVPRATTLMMSADSFAFAAKRGDVEFFERVSDTFRRPERVTKRAAGGSAKDLLLQFWLPGGLWRLSVPDGQKRVNEYVRRMKSTPPMDAPTEITKAEMLGLKAGA